MPALSSMKSKPCRLLLGETSLYPDFTIKKPRTGQLAYWEHYGLMDDYKYQASFRSKTNLYCQNGIFPGVNLFMTFESASHPLQTKDVSAIIDKLLEY